MEKGCRVRGHAQELRRGAEEVKRCEEAGNMQRRQETCRGGEVGCRGGGGTEEMNRGAEEAGNMQRRQGQVQEVACRGDEVRCKR